MAKNNNDDVRIKAKDAVKAGNQGGSTSAGGSGSSSGSGAGSSGTSTGSGSGSSAGTANTGNTAAGTSGNTTAGTGSGTGTSSGSATNTGAPVGKGINTGSVNSGSGSVGGGVGQSGTGAASGSGSAGTGAASGSGSVGSASSAAGNTVGSVAGNAASGMAKGAMGAKNAATGIAQSISGAAKAAGAKVAGAAKGVVGTVGKGMAAGAKAIGMGAVQVSTAAATATTIAVTGVTAAGVGAGVSAYIDQQRLIQGSHQLPKDCLTDVKAGMHAALGEGGNIDVSAKQMEIATKVTAVLRGVGLPDEHIAGALGNFMVESSMDPTIVEGLYGRGQFEMTPEKAELVGDLTKLSSYVTGTLFPAYSAKGVPVDHDFYEYPDGSGIYVCGLGLPQFTGPEAYDLFDFAKKINKGWWEVDTQLAFIIRPKAQGGYKAADWLLNWKTQPEGNPSTAAYSFAANFEGNTTLGQAERKMFAEQWFVRIKEMQVDTAYANSIIALAGTTLNGAGANGMANAEANCDDANGIMPGNNSSMAVAFVSLSWEHKEDSWGNNGIEMYRKVKPIVSHGDLYYMSCDRGVQAAVAWSGSDDDFPLGNVVVQQNYMMTSPRWQAVPWGGDISKLSPGDVLVSDSHIVMYVGNEAVKQIYPNAPATMNLCHSSYGERSPAVDALYNTGMNAYRCINTEKSPKYMNAHMDPSGTIAPLAADPGQYP